jgi:hypothetical protein
MKKYIILFILALLLIPNVVSCPPSMEERLSVKEITFNSDEFYFLDTYLNKTNLTSRYRMPFPYFRHFNYSGNPKYLKITINNEELINEQISTLKGSTVMQNTTTGEIKSIIVYNFPNEKIYGELYIPKREQGTLINYNNSNIKIFLDDKLVREYTMGYQPAIINKCPMYTTTVYEFLAIIAIIAIMIITMITLIILKIRRKRH